jgi:plastocyanin
MKYLAVVILLVVAVACNQTQSNPTSKTPVLSTPIDPSTVASISGTVRFDGAAPAPPKIDMSQDPACGGQATYSDALVVSNGKLANTFIYVKEGMGDRHFAPPLHTLTITQKGCRYIPHVAGVVAGQKVKFINGDATTHNIHVMPTQVRQWNESQMPDSGPIEKSFDTPEVMIPIKCNQHPWMRMYLNVVASPFFAVSDDQGNFSITGLPPGDYTLAAVHERLGEQDVKISIRPKETKAVEFTYRNQP